MKKLRIPIWVKVIVVVTLLIGLAVIIRGASDKLYHRYDPVAPTAEKFALAAKWLPRESDIIVAVDAQKALENPILKDRLTSIVKERHGVAAELVASLISRRNVVGMLVLAGSPGKEGSSPAFVVIAQGEFDEESFIPAIRAALATGRAGLASKELQGKTLYLESDVSDPFGFIVFDRKHIAVGSRDSLETLYAEEVGASSGAMAVPAGAILFGRVSVGQRLAALLPKDLPPPASIEFYSNDANAIVADIPCADTHSASSTRMFLEGIRSLVLLREEGNEAITKVLKGVSINASDTGVMVRSDAIPLLDLWGALRSEKQVGETVSE